jgi:2,3-bisphosphoglycerate-independent phosphoglycerate mutase
VNNSKRRKPDLKLIYIVIDGMGDLPIKELGNKTPLGAAKTPNMDNLARTGKTGLMYTVCKGIAPESDVAVISILGYDPFTYETGRGVLEAVGSGVKVKNGDLALRCNFATLGERNHIIDRRVGRDLTTEEALKLSQSINEQVTLESYPANFDFKSTIGHRALLVIQSKAKPLSGKITNTDPAYTKIGGIGVAERNTKMVLRKCKPMDKSNEAKVSATLVNEFIQKSHAILDRHEINRNRAVNGKLKANIILARDAGSSLPNFFKINERYNVRFACLADMPVERGIAKLAGMSLIDLPPPSGDLKSDSLLRVNKLLEILPLYDCVYIHIKSPDEPGHDGNFMLKKRLIEMIDKHFFGELLPKINLSDCVICVTADHSTPCMLRTHSDDPVPLLISGNRIRGDEVSKFSEAECLKGSLGLLQKGTQLMPMLMDFLKAG